ncbi:MAG: HNH endonuclease signature motif containing protein [Deferribacterales bacterium]
MNFHITFLKQNIKGISYKDLTELFNSEFGLALSVDQIRSTCKRHELTNDCPRGHRRGQSPNQKFFAVHIDFLKENITGRSIAELTLLFNEHFKTDHGRDSIKRICSVNHLCNGRNTRFKKGHIPWDKGKKGFMGANRTSFKKGNRPKNAVEVGTEITDRDGYLKVKISEPNVWKYKHRMIWENAHGEIPEGHAIIFADGDKQNITLENLILVSRAELAYLNHNKLIAPDGSLTHSAVLLAKVAQTAAKLQRESD